MDLEKIKRVNKMRETVKKELEYIPRGNLPQNLLRNTYSSLRLHSLGRKSKKTMNCNEVLKICVENIKKDYPEFKPDCNSNFFKGGICKKSKNGMEKR